MQSAESAPLSLECLNRQEGRTSLSILPGPSVAVGAWHSRLSPHSNYLVALPKNVKNAAVAATIFPKTFVSH